LISGVIRTVTLLVSAPMQSGETGSTQPVHGSVP
jgi:hypothetical protein